ncbi:enoyl-CoA hydratase/isomerase family protein [Ammoniphilus sp. YIM 78166]|uniref:enoyl-CoA hydratase/isomerase family protein n=1 Tax=Ammoniphilus sp. YIM 78166 TaxID=1644106 RepID=UPI001070395A|nr:enoyl-CoA hydratase/isomerase family protein [Ammoniphilus sp. YIM 78166]
MNMKVSIESGIAKVTLNHPPMNLLAEKVKEEIAQLFRRIAEDEKVRVILFFAQGDHFCCGANLKEFPERIQNKKAREVWDRGHDMLSSILNAPQPTIACIEGSALGGGAELASAFDLRIFESHAQVGYPEVARGVFPGNGGLERLISLVGETHAMRLALTGKKISAEEALRIGLASGVAASGKGRRHCEELANTLSHLPGTAVRTIKQAIRAYVKDPQSFGDKGKEMFYHVHETHDVREAVQAFLEKRKPVFTHL